MDHMAHVVAHVVAMRRRWPHCRAGGADPVLAGDTGRDKGFVPRAATGTVRYG